MLQWWIDWWFLGAFYKPLCTISNQILRGGHQVFQGAGSFGPLCNLSWPLDVSVCGRRSARVCNNEQSTIKVDLVVSAHLGDKLFKCAPLCRKLIKCVAFILMQSCGICEQFSLTCSLLGIYKLHRNKIYKKNNKTTVIVFFAWIGCAWGDVGDNEPDTLFSEFFLSPQKSTESYQFRRQTNVPACPRYNGRCLLIIANERAT